jgi:hypothetical protein
MKDYTIGKQGFCIRIVAESSISWLAHGWRVAASQNALPAFPFFRRNAILPAIGNSTQAIGRISYR